MNSIHSTCFAYLLYACNSDAAAFRYSDTAHWQSRTDSGNSGEAYQ